jgi:hypothetical protein
VKPVAFGIIHWLGQAACEDEMSAMNHELLFHVTYQEVKVKALRDKRSGKQKACEA